MAHRFGISGVSSRLLAGKVQIGYCLRGVRAAAVVAGQFVQVIVQPLGEESFNHLASSLVQQPAPIYPRNAKAGSFEPLALRLGRIRS